MPERFMPTWRERGGIGVVPRTDTVPDAETPSAETLIVVNPTRSGLDGIVLAAPAAAERQHRKQGQALKEAHGRGSQETNRPHLRGCRRPGVTKRAGASRTPVYRLVRGDVP